MRRDVSSAYLPASAVSLSPANLIKPQNGSKKQLLSETKYSIPFHVATFTGVNSDASFRSATVRNRARRRSGGRGLIFCQADDSDVGPDHRSRHKLGLRR